MEVGPYSSEMDKTVAWFAAESMVVDTLSLAGKSLACLLLMTGALLGAISKAPGLTSIENRFPIDELHKAVQPGPENKDASDTEEDEDEDGADDQDDDDDEDFSGGEGGDDDDEEGEGNPEEDAEANGDGGSDEDDDEDGDEEDDDEDENDEDEDEEEEDDQPPAKKRK